jgi:hypothetical protein
VSRALDLPPQGAAEDPDGERAQTRAERHPNPFGEGKRPGLPDRIDGRVQETLPQT